MTGSFSIGLRSLPLLWLWAIPLTAAPAELLITNAKIYTMNAAKPQVEALAVREGRIVAAGSRQELSEWQGAKTKVLMTISAGRVVYSNSSAAL